MAGIVSQRPNINLMSSPLITKKVLHS